MRNIKYEITLYREAVRHLWNSSYAMLEDSLRYGICLEIFLEIDYLIFRSLVCEPLGLVLKARSSFDPIKNLKVIPNNIHSDAIFKINRTVPASGYWDYPVKILNVSDIDCAFICFFDWDEYNVKDCAYYRVRIIDCQSNPDLIGRDALLETSYAEVFLEEAVLESKLRGHP
jgi:hypothetical protein